VIEMDAFYWLALILLLTAMSLLIDELGEKRRRPHYLYDKNPMTPNPKKGHGREGKKGGTT